MVPTANIPGAPELEPTLALCFARGVPGPVARHAVPAEGLILGRDSALLAGAARDAGIAVRHAEILVDRRGQGVVRDLGSAGGTRCNGEFIEGAHPLEPGDVIRLGDTLLVWAPAASGRPAGRPLALGESAGMIAVQRSIHAVAARRQTVVVTGETGTGKEVVAQHIHQGSGREGPFVAVNCSTFTEALLPSELFGHVKGAFTGAVMEHPGLFRAARGGTLLLDELADIPLSLQASLLRVLETQEVRPVGGTKDIAIDVRVVATTHTELADLVRSGRFRADLYARLAQWTIRLPRLRDRRDDIPLLAAGLLARAEGEGRRVTADLAEALLAHDWPLNVRGLLNILSIAVVSTPSMTGPLELTPEVQVALHTTRSMGPTAARVAEPVRTTLDREELEELMIRFHGHVAAAGRHVGMTRSKLYRLLETHGLEPNGFRVAQPRGADALDVDAVDGAPEHTPWLGAPQPGRVRLQHNS